MAVREVPSWDYWGCVGEAACVGKVEILEDLERSPGAWVLLACRHWVACCPSLDWEQRPHYSHGKPWPRWNVHMSPSGPGQRSTDPRIHTTMSVKILEVPQV